jgi:hypothetical protein
MYMSKMTMADVLFEARALETIEIAGAFFDDKSVHCALQFTNVKNLSVDVQNCYSYVAWLKEMMPSVSKLVIKGAAMKDNCDEAFHCLMADYAETVKEL